MNTKKATPASKADQEPPIKLNRKEFVDKVRACWIGKNIGGTLGAPHECKRYALGLEFYDPIPTKAAPNDDLDLQLIWLKLLEDRGTDPSVRDLADYWVRHAASYPWNEYGFFMRNYSRGLRPPVAGCFENYYVDEMGSPIRSEIWAVIHAGDPQAAARMAWKDSSLDHAGGEGTYGEMFWCAVQAAAFVEKDPMTLINIGLHMIPMSSHIARSIREAVWCFENHVSWGDAREKIAVRFGHIQPCNAVPNHGFTILGWLYGKDFGDKLLKAVNCGYDTDCTGATLGALLGILGGTSAIPSRWLEPVGLGILLHKFTRHLAAPKDVDELTARTVAVAEKAFAQAPHRSLGDRTILPKNLRTRLFDNRLAVEALKQSIHQGIELCQGREVAFDYGGEPVLRPGIGQDVAVLVDGRAENVELKTPAGWKVKRLGINRFQLLSEKKIAPRNTVTVVLRDGQKVDFTILGPDEAKGFPAGVSVPHCPKCGARVESCMCG